MNLYEHIKADTNFKYTENGAITHESTLDKVLDMFAMGGAYRNRTDKAIEELFGDAYRQNEELALKCLFYLRDCRGGQGERRFFRVAYKWLCRNDSLTAKLNLSRIPEYGRWDDLIDIGYTMYLENKSIYDDIINIIANQMDVDNVSKTPSLLAKWMPSENASSAETKAKARWIRTNLPSVSAKEYRQRLSSVRKKINILERLMSENRWDEIEFDKIPSVAGMRYRNTFAVKEVTAARYKAFMESKTTKVNASVLNPVDIANKVIKHCHCSGWWGEYDGTVNLNKTEIDTLCKYWDNLKDYYQGREENAIAVVDVSGSMTGQPMAAAVGMGAYVATKSHGPFANHFITFSDNPKLVEFEGDNIVDKIARCVSAEWGYSTNIEAVMDLLLNTAVKHHMSQSDLPTRLYIFSDMEFNRCIDVPNYFGDKGLKTYETLFESIERKWNKAGYEMPTITFWNLAARQNNIPAIGPKFNYISGFSMSQMEAVMAGKTAVDMMLDVLLSDRYADIRVYEQLGASTIACSEN